MAVSTDVTDRLVIDPRFERWGMTPSAVSLLEEGSKKSSQYRLRGVLRLTGEVWPKGIDDVTLRLRCYDADDVEVDYHYVSLERGLDQTLRQVQATAYSTPGVRFELGFDEGHLPQFLLDELEVAAADAEVEAGPPDDGWIRLDVRRDEQGEAALDLVADGVLAQYRQHFDFKNQFLIEVSGQVTAVPGTAFVPRLTAQFRVYNTGGDVLAVSEVAMSTGPRARRGMAMSTTIYNHISPAYVSVEFYDR